VVSYAGRFMDEGTSRPDAPTSSPSLIARLRSEDGATPALLKRCEDGILAGCYAFEITMPDNVGDTTRELGPACDRGDEDACAAWGCALANGTSPGAPVPTPAASH
jgi:hypothetical protein